jgi:hypothetical protein
MIEYYVFFCDNSINNLFLSKLKKGFGHVEIFNKEGLYISPTSNGLFIKNMNFEEMLSFSINSGIVLRYKFNNKSKYRSLISVNTCVGVVKDILNIRSLLVQTPYQLHNYILNNNGEKIWQQQHRS